MKDDNNNFNNVVPFPGKHRNLDKESSSVPTSHESQRLETEKQKIFETAAKCILKALDAKDHYTFGHSMRVCYYSMIVGQELELSSDELYELELCSLFHDIGKIGTPDAVLNKPTRLNNDEFIIMKEHPTQSYEIIKQLDGLENIARFALHHHERFDGRGYPEGLKGEKIPLFSRIILIADTFDAMTSTRVYRKGLPYELAYAELKEFSGTQFDPKLVDIFIEGMKKEQDKNEDSFYISIMGESYKKEAA